MPDIKEFFDANAEKKVLTTFFPAIVAFWPIYIVITQDYEELSNNLKQLNTTLNVVFFALFFIVVYGIGHFINKLALRAEVRLDDWYCRPKNNGAPFNGVSPKTFEDVWYKYLQQVFTKENTPILLKYYSTFIRYYHFELTCIIALRIQTVLLIVLELHYYNDFSDTLFWSLIIVIAVSTGLIFYLRYEGKQAVGHAHFLRLKIIEVNNPRYVISLSSSREKEVVAKLKPNSFLKKWHCNLLYGIGFRNCLPYADFEKDKNIFFN